MKKFHLILVTGEERDVTGEDVEVGHDGSLVIGSHEGPVVIYAPGAWTLCELERKDDRD
jgi:hypothetical protein